MWGQAKAGEPALGAGHSGAVSSLAFSPDGRILYSISGKDSTLRSWNAASGAALSVKTVQGRDWGSASDGAALKAVLYTRYSLVVIDLKTGESIGGVSHPVGGPDIMAYAISPDWTRALTSERGGAAILWDLKTGKVITRKRVHPREAVEGFVFVKNGSAALCSLGLLGSSVWSFSTGEVIDQALRTNLSRIQGVPSKSGTDLVLGIRYGKSIECWDMVKGILEDKPLVVLEASEEYPVSMSVSSDGSLAAAGYKSGAVRIWRLADGSQAAELKTMDSEASALAFSPDGKRLATTCGAGEIEIWDVATARRLVETERPALTLASASADGRYSVKGSRDGVLTLSEAAGGRVVWSVPTNRGRPIVLALSPKGDRAMAAFLNGSMLFLDGRDGKTISEIPAVSKAKVQSLELSEEGACALVLDASGGAAILEPSTSTVLRPVDKSDQFSCAVFSPDGSMAALGKNDGRAVIFITAPGKYEVYGGTENYNSNKPVSALAFSPDGVFLAFATMDGKCSVRGVKSLREYYLKETLGAPVAAIHFEAGPRKPQFRTADGKFAFMELPDITHFTRIGSLAFSPDGKTLYSGGADGSVRAWDWSASRETARYSANAQGVRILVAAADGQRLFSVGEEERISVLALPDGSKTSSREGSSSRIDILSPDGLYYSGIKEPTVIDLATGKSPFKFDPQVKLPKFTHLGWMNGGALSSDGKLLYTSDEDGSLFLWDTASGKAKKATVAGEPAPDFLAIASGGKRGAGGFKDGKLLLWDPSAAKLVATLAPSGAAVTALAFTPKGDILVSADSSGVLSVWSAAKGALVRKLEGHTKSVTAVVVSPDGKYAASAGEDGKILVWSLIEGALAATMEKTD